MFKVNRRIVWKVVAGSSAIGFGIASLAYQDIGLLIMTIYFAIQCMRY